VEPHGRQPISEAGEPLGRAPVVIMVHGRNAGPENILDLVPKLARPAFTYLAPAAAGRTWYPHSFMADIGTNEPGLTSALAMLESLVSRVEASGVPRSRIVMLGFSQGACLTAEFAVRHASRFGGFVILTGGVIGPEGTEWRHPGTFDGTPIFLGSGDPDRHVPASRVLETAAIFSRMGAAVTTRIYPGRPHTVSEDEMAIAQTVLDEVSRVTVLSGPGGLARLPAELDARALRRVMVVTTSRQARESGDPGISLRLGDRLAGVSETATLHVPIERVRAAVADAARVGADAILAFGGGSAMGVAKAVALERPMPIVAVPTTYSGSEMTSVWGVTDGSIKRTGRDARVRPCVVLYDPAFTLSLPPRVSAASGMNAIAHAVEAMYASDASPIAAAAADLAIVSLARALPQIAVRPADAEARGLALRGAHAAGVALEHSSMGLHHKICHVLGGSFGLPHAETHAAILPFVVAFNAQAAPDAMARVARALGASDAAEGIRVLNRTLGLSMSLQSLGFAPDDVDRAADLVASASYPNPRPVRVDDIRALLKSAL
jgi:maleylacetate reductase